MKEVLVEPSTTNCNSELPVHNHYNNRSITVNNVTTERQYLSICITFLLTTFIIFTIHPYIAVYIETNVPGCPIEVSESVVNSLPQMHKTIRHKVAQYFKGDNGVLFMAGADVANRYDTDVELSFRQESNFLYFTGYRQPNASVLYDLQKNEAFLFIPNRPVDYAVWNGKVEDPNQIQQEYDFDGVIYHDKFDEFLEMLSKGDPQFVVYTEPKDSFRIPSKYSKNTSKLQKSLYSSRAIKIEEEIQLIWQACNISSAAHVEVMKEMRAGIYEFTVEGTFLNGCFNCASRHQAYSPIVGAGNNSAILHYTANNKQLNNGQIFLIDAGAELFGYGADITRTFPVNGKFSSDQAEVYQMVYNIQHAVYEVAKPGNAFGLLETTCQQHVCDELSKNGFIKANVDECLSNRINRLFMPHSVSHYLGLDVHDRYDPPSPPLTEGNVLTVEPGIYFNSALLLPALENPSQAKYLNADKIKRFVNEEFGGVRIEDDIVIRSYGYQLLSEGSPSTIAEIEKLMNN